MAATTAMKTQAEMCMGLPGSLHKEIKRKNTTGTSGQETVPTVIVGLGQQWGKGISRDVLCMRVPFR